jgi:CelD/BcsL family acetyltransferase involved in cellulose biosynthesis
VAGSPDSSANYPGGAQGLGRGLTSPEFLTRELSEWMQRTNHLRLVPSDRSPGRSWPLLQVNNTNQASALRCEVVSDFSDLEKISPDWERLWQTDGRAEIFQTFAWARAWWHSYGRDFTLCAPVVFDGNKIIGILPLAKRGNIVQFLGTPEADYADLLCEEGREKEVLTAALGALFHSVTAWNECILQHLAKDGRVVRHCRDLPRDLRRRVKLVPAGRYQTILLQENREEIFSSLLGKNHTRRRHNKLKKAGEVTLRRIQTKSEAQEHLNYFFLHHIRRCALLGRESTCARPEFRRFLQAVVEELDPSGPLRFEVLELDGRPFAWHFSFLVNGKFLLYQHTFDLDSWDYAPGEVLLSHLLQFAQENVTREFDFGSGDEAYKNRFARHTRETFSLYIEPRDLKGRLRGLFRAGQGFLSPAVSNFQQRAKTHTSTFRILRSIRISTSGFMGRIRQAKKDGSLLKYGLRGMMQLVRGTVWGKEELDVFPWEGFVGPDGGPVAGCPGNDEVEITMGRFGDLVDLATERADAVVANELPEFRQRLKKGDRFYVGRKSGQAALLAWTSTNAKDALNNELSRAINPERPALVMYDLWTAPGLSDGGLCWRFLSVLRLEAAGKKLDLLIRCRPDHVTFRTELEHQRFLPEYRIVRYSLFHWLRWTRSFQTKKTVADQALVVGTAGT